MRLLSTTALLALFWLIPGAIAQSTSTTLTLTSGGSAVTAVNEGAVVTLTATVLTGSTPIAPGQVEFCSAAPPHCTDIHLLGVAQLSAAGTAALRFVPGGGVHNYQAVFMGTHSAAGSSSNPVALSVGFFSPTTTTITNPQFLSAGTYSLDVTVSGTDGLVPITGTVSILDTNNSNYVLGTAPLVAGPPPPNGQPPSDKGGVGFTQPVVSPAVPDNGFAAVADFNGDGKPDVAVTYAPPCPVPPAHPPPPLTGVGVYLGNEDGTFTKSTSFQTGNCFMEPQEVVAGDFNGDGKPDIAVVTQGNTVGNVLNPTNGPENTWTVYLGNGDGTLATGQLQPSSVNPEPIFIAAGDFNGDGIADLAVINANGFGNATYTTNIMLGNGDGTFTEKSSIATSDKPVAIAVGDFDGDGIQDMAVANSNSTKVTILFGNGDGTFRPAAVNPSTGPIPNPAAITVADFNGDGFLDLAVGNAGVTVGATTRGMVTILLGNGDGTFRSVDEITTFNGTNSIVVGDFNADGFPDVAVSQLIGLVQVMLGNGDGTFMPLTNLTPQGAPNSIVAADVNGDGATDILSMSYDDGSDSFINGLLAQVGPAGTTITASATVSDFFVVGTGPHQVVAHFPGDVNYQPSTSGTEGLTAQPEPTTLSFMASPAMSNAGQPVTLTVLVNPMPAQNHTPVGTVTFMDGQTVVGTSSVVNGATTFNTTMLVAGVDTLTANYSGDTNFAPSSNTSTETVTGSASVTVLTVTPNPALVGQAFTVSAAVSGVGISRTATGTVTFYNGSTAIGQGTLDATGHASATAAGLPLGSYAITAAYSGDAVIYAGTSPAVTLVVNPYASAVVLTAAPNPSGTGQTITLTAGVTGVGNSVVPTGLVTFYDGVTRLGQGTLDGSAHATLSTAALTLGTHSLTATYTGDPFFAAGTSPVFFQVVESPGFSLSLSSPSISLQTYQHTTTTVTLTSVGNFADSIAIACANLPTYASCIFTPQSATLAANGTTTVAFYLDTDSIIGGTNGPLHSSREQPPSAVSFAMLLTPFSLFAVLAARRRRSSSISLLLLAILALPIALGITACGDNQITPVPSTAPGTYTITIAASGATTGLTRTAQLTLTVTP